MTRKSLGDKFREAAGLIADGRCSGTLEALHALAVPFEDECLFTAMFFCGLYPFYDREHRVIALLTCACMADTGDLK